MKELIDHHGTLAIPLVNIAKVTNYVSQRHNTVAEGKSGRPAGPARRRHGVGARPGAAGLGLGLGLGG